MRVLEGTVKGTVRSQDNGRQSGRKNKGAPLYGGHRVSRSVSRVLSRTIIHLGRASPLASSDLPESAEGHGIGSLFGLAPGGVYHRHGCYQPRGALLPHLFTLTCEQAVSFLLHFPWARAPQALPGALTRWSPDFPLPPWSSDRLTNSTFRLSTTSHSRKLNYPAFFPITTGTGRAQRYR